VRLLLMKELFKAGVLNEAVIEPASTNKGSWVLNVVNQQGEKVSVTLAEKSSEAKIYVRLNAALMDAYRIGFRDVATRLPEEFAREDGPRTGLR
jgi:hypothetical protein